jgi:hypothetical protein
VRVVLRFFDDCTNWQTMAERVRQALDRTGHADVQVVLEKVASAEDAERLGFIGSPTILVDGTDPFAQPGWPFGLTCRVYGTAHGLAGSPTVDQLVEILRLA